MNAQDKAKQLVEKYRTYVRLADKYDLNLGSDEIYIAKECSLLAVDEIIDSEALEPQQKRHIIQNVPPIKCQLEYWFKVKTEIEKI